MKIRCAVTLALTVVLQAVYAEPVSAQVGIFGDEWRGTECLVRDPTGTELNVRERPGGRVIQTLKNNTGVIPDRGGKNSPWVEIRKVIDGRLRPIGFVWSKHVDCNAELRKTKYPVLLSSDADVAEVGIGWFVGSTDYTKRAGLRKCAYQGEGHTVGISESIVTKYEKQGFNFAKICLALASGDTRYDPETGKRLATYLFVGWPDYGIPEEFALEIPRCYKTGEIRGMGTYFHSFNPSGCKLNFHPWTGRKLDASEAGAYRSALRISAGGEAGPSSTPESELRQSKMAKGDSTTLGELKMLTGVAAKSNDAGKMKPNKN